MRDNTGKIPAYEAFVWRKRLVLILTTVFTLAIALVATSFGSLNIPLSEVIKTIFGQGEDVSKTVILGIRLPRVTAAILVGAILAAAGAVMQCVLRNPLASASTLGVSQGAAFGAAIGIIVFGGGVVNSGAASVAVEINNPYIVTVCAFVFGGLSTVVIIGISQLKRSIGPTGLILAGVALSSLFAGGSTLLQYFADDTKISAVVFWTFGNLGGASWKELAILAVVLAGSLLYFMLNRWNYNAMESGADTARSLGVNTRSVMLVSMGICSLASAVAVSFVGIISFIGLIAPHIMRRFVGSDYRYLVPCSAAAGALLLILADTFGRLIIAPVILPIGAITSFLGAPLFLGLLFKGKDAMVEVKDVCYAYSRSGPDVLKDVGFKATEKQCIAILGNNGAGKSTLLKCMDKICPVRDGAVLISGENVFKLSGRELATKLAYVPQSTEPANITVFDAVLLGRKPYIKWDASEEDRAVVCDVLHRLSLEALALRKLCELSGGEAQKVVLARALAQEPRFLLLDEPTSNLDLHNQHEVLRTIKSIATERGITVAIIIHDLNLAIRYCDRFLFLKDAGVYSYGGIDTVTPETIERVYGMHVHITECMGIPVVVPFPDEPVRRE